ncbi:MULTISPECIES: glutamate ABC transporter substrate-binding protein [unclassified Microbacterium]|uniref:glutamate ABC transporter substrate-binding protein n=1 Tax=unclassified Microbacterium TaxID=2609290 RepID=UPI00214B337A|nr:MULTISPECIES: glutamate ABC transporter substrate-binding protein [unclassified Microbacterium]MCR2801464.1 glutamate ABC transporter substrate-binding protein [Microbacterium sp. zg.Y818]MCR2827295.1 glutamate ABC transporter substrate-binding protein [Microbacterium sp. zg.Y909]WIM23253.1 glutamate ABC transporter substrate-binding protein [Microbacterium sp. zg-Y818]
MRINRIGGAVAAFAVAALALTGCNSGTPGATDDSTGDAAEETTSGTPWMVAEDVTIEGSPTFDAITDRGSVVVGVKEDQPGLGFLDPATGERTGFDVDVARWIAASLGYDEDDIEFQPIASANREQALVNGDIDYYVGTYSITDKRKEQIAFAGPYFITGQGLLVAADNEDITGIDALTADHVVCSATGSTSVQRIKDETPAQTKEYDTYSTCVEDLKNNQVDAVTTDEAILIGYAAQDPENLKVVGEPFSEERYGVGIAKGDTALQEYINTMFTDGGEVWEAIFSKNLGASGVSADQPEVDAAE